MWVDETDGVYYWKTLTFTILLMLCCVGAKKMFVVAIMRIVLARNSVFM